MSGLRATTPIATVASFHRPWADPVVSARMFVMVLSRSRYPGGINGELTASTTNGGERGERPPPGHRHAAPRHPGAASVRKPARENVTMTAAMPSSSADAGDETLRHAAPAHEQRRRKRNQEVEHQREVVGIGRQARAADVVAGDPLHGARRRAAGTRRTRSSAGR